MPAWQAPDEPAHYNYVHELASTGQFPVLRMGDYDEAYLEQLKSQGFPPSLPIHPVRYEAHQPPLYYLLASAVFRLTQGQLLFLRLFSVALGAIFVVLTYEIVRQIYPQRAALRLAAAAFVAFLPMHVAMAASVNNDALAEVLLAGILLLSIRYVKHWLLGPDQPGWLQALALGLLLGLALVTKVSAYVAIPVVLAALVIAWYETRHATSASFAYAGTKVHTSHPCGAHVLASTDHRAALVRAQRPALWTPGYSGPSMARFGGGRPATHGRFPGSGRPGRPAGAHGCVELRQLLGRVRLDGRVDGRAACIRRCLLSAWRRGWDVWRW